MELHEFKLPYQNSCSKCGKVLPAGDRAFAMNRDEIVAGLGICFVCAKVKLPPIKEPAPVPTPAPVPFSPPTATPDFVKRSK
jgi:hypothetical protein